MAIFAKGKPILRVRHFALWKRNYAHSYVDGVGSVLLHVYVVAAWSPKVIIYLAYSLILNNLSRQRNRRAVSGYGKIICVIRLFAFLFFFVLFCFCCCCCFSGNQRYITFECFNICHPTFKHPVALINYPVVSKRFYTRLRPAQSFCTITQSMSQAWPYCFLLCRVVCNSLTPGRRWYHFEIVILRTISFINASNICCDASMWIPEHSTYQKSSLVRVKIENAYWKNTSVTNIYLSNSNKDLERIGFISHKTCKFHHIYVNSKNKPIFYLPVYEASNSCFCFSKFLFSAIMPVKYILMLLGVLLICNRPYFFCRVALSYVGLLWVFCCANCIALHHVVWCQYHITWTAMRLSIP